jgi:hypothetical protein
MGTPPSPAASGAQGAEARVPMRQTREPRPSSRFSLLTLGYSFRHWVAGILAFGQRSSTDLLFHPHLSCSGRIRPVPELLPLSKALSTYLITPVGHAPFANLIMPVGHAPSAFLITPVGHAPSADLIMPVGHAPSAFLIMPVGHAPSVFLIMPVGHTPSANLIMPVGHTPSSCDAHPVAAGGSPVLGCCLHW